MVKVLVFADLHGSERRMEIIQEKAPQADLILCAGDISVFERDIEALMDALEALKTPLFIIHGNHEDPYTMEELCGSREHITFIHKKIVHFQDIPVVGFGGGGFAQEEQAFANWVQGIDVPKRSVLVTHPPPYNTNLDDLHGEHVGVTTFRTFIEEHHPRLAVSGHIHENQGKEDTIGDTKVLNPGPQGMLLDL